MQILPDIDKRKLLKTLLPVLAIVGLCLVLSACGVEDYNTSMDTLDGEYRQKANCWGCTIFEALFNAIDDMITVLYDKIADGARNLLALIFAFWIAFHVGKMLLSFKEPDTQEFWTDMTKTAFAVIFCAVVLTNKNTLFEFLFFTIVPVFEGVIDVAVAVISQSFGEIGVEADYTSCTLAPTGDASITKALGDNMRETLVCLIFEMHKRLTYGFFFAYKLMATGGFVEWVFALFLLLIFFLLSFMFPFYLVDGIFRIGIAFILLPILVAFWPFKVLRSYVTPAWNLIFGAFIHIMMMAIFVTLIVEILVDFTNLAVGRIDQSEELIENTINAPEAMLFMAFLGFYCIKFVGNVNLISGQMSDTAASTALFTQAIKKMMQMAGNLGQAGMNKAKQMGAAKMMGGKGGGKGGGAMKK